MKNVKRIVLCLALLAVGACSKVPVGAVGIKVNNMGSDKGVAAQVLSTGWYWVGFTNTLYTFPTFMQTKKWEGDEMFSFQTGDGMVVKAPISLSYSVDPEKVPVLFQTYRKGLDEITEVYIHNIIRDALVEAASTRAVDDVYGPGKVKLLTEVQKKVSDKIGPLGIKVDQISLVGQFDLPKNVVDAINSKIQATQMAQQRENEVATAKAEAQKTVAIAQGAADSRTLQANAEAKANQTIAASITPGLIDYMKTQKWNGSKCTVGCGADAGGVPTVNVIKAAGSDDEEKNESK